MCCSERMITMSLDGILSGSGGNDSTCAAIARSDSGLFVGASSVVKLSPRSATMATIATANTAIQARIVRHGWRALAVASV